MRTHLLLIALLILSYKSTAQTTETGESEALVRLAKLDIGLHGLGVAYELPFSERWSVDLSAGLGGGYSVWGNDFKSTFVINDPVAYFKSEVKYTYNRARRLSRSKSIIHNTGNFIAFQTKYTTRRVFGSPSMYDGGYDFLNRTLLNEVHWGIQRPLGQNFLFNMHLGLGYAADFDFNDTQAYPAAGVRFAYILKKGQ